MVARILHPEVQTRKPYIGKDVYIKEPVLLDCTGQIIIGDGTWILEHAKLYTHRHSAMSQEVKVSDLTIGKRVTIGTCAIITPLCNKIGDGSTVALGSVVFDDVPKNVLVAGNPAKIIRRYG